MGIEKEKGYRKKELSVWQREREGESGRQRWREIETNRQTDKERDLQTDRQTEKERKEKFHEEQKD